MVIPQISLPIAFAIGLPIGVAGYFGQELLLRRRSRRRAAAGAEGGAWGPLQGGDGGGAVTTDRPEGAGAGGVPPPVPAGGQKRGRGARVAATGAASPAFGVPEVASTRANLTERRQRTAAVRNLQRREATLEAALEEVVAFVESEPRRNRARTCAWALEGLIPKTRRSRELSAFLRDVEGAKSPSTLQEEAEEVGLQLARELKTVKAELRTISG